MGLGWQTMEFITRRPKNNPSVEFELNFEENKRAALVLQIKGEAAKNLCEKFCACFDF